MTVILSIVCGMLFALLVVVFFGAKRFWNGARMFLAHNNQLREEKELALTALDEVTTTLEHLIEKLCKHPQVAVDAHSLTQVSRLISHARRVGAMPGEQPMTGAIDRLEGENKNWPFRSDGTIDARNIPR